MNPAPYWRQPDGEANWRHASAVEEQVVIEINHGHRLVRDGRTPPSGDLPLSLEFPDPTPMEAYVEALTDLLQAAAHDGHDLLEVIGQALDNQRLDLKLAEDTARDRKEQR